MTADALALDLARLEFGVSASIHYLFVPLTLGLALALCLMEAAHVRTGLGVWADAARFWRRFFLLAWLVGMATGYPLRWQLQAHWPGYSDSAHEVLAAVMALEGWIAPLMMTLVAGLSLAAGGLGPRTRLGLSVLLLLAMVAQAAGILTMNAWMQHPVGVTFTTDGARLASLADVFANPYAHTKIAHTLSASVVTGAFFMLAVAGGYVRVRRHLPVARVSLRVGLGLGLAGIVATLYTGHESALDIARHQPMKFAAMEAHWTTEDDALVLWARPDVATQDNQGALELPHAMGLLMGGEERPAGLIELMARSKQQIRLALRPDAPPELAAWRGLFRQAADQHAAVWPRLSEEARLDLAARLSCPDVPVLFTTFRLMAAMGVLLLVLLVLAWRRRRSLETGPDGRRTVAWLIACAPLPWAATLSGWMTAEMGRQPWVVYGRLLTAEAATPMAMAPDTWALAARLSCLVLLVGLFAFGAAWLWRRGPGPLPRWPAVRALRPSLR
ncbi:MAG TPA: cytochrome ubiquinol oxidase subunit I [Ideonella sp.]|nr:cytochrome ubiquinol oxidase subunit I [Ideonella sp.]